MDVTSTTVGGRMPLSNRRRLSGATSLASDRAALAACRPAASGYPAHAAGGGGSAGSVGSPGEVTGVADGAMLVLPSGVRIQRRRIGTAQVSAAELSQAIQGIQLLPFAHQRAIAILGIPIELVPVQQLEQVAGTTQPVVGATAIDGPVGAGHPTRVRIATHSPWAAQGGAQGIGEIVQHELGHVISVLVRQDRSEAAATRYAETY